MTRIKVLTDQICDELDGARHYAENFVEQKVKGNSGTASRYKSMAEDELRHATYLHELVVSEIEEIQKTVTAPANMIQRWNDKHAEYVDKSAWVKQMLSM